MAMKKDLLTSILLGMVLALAIPRTAMSQNCNCSPDLCCSQYGFCGTGEAYCGQRCQAGPCTSSSPTPSGSSGSSVADIATAEFFDGIKNQAAADCAGKSFYTRDDFLNAVNSFSEFGSGSADDSRREIAAFFAHVMHETGHKLYISIFSLHETGHLCYLEEIDKSNAYCYPSYTQDPCAAGKFYYGRGPLQITHNYNYGAAGQAINFDGLNSPETVATDPAVSFKTALWFWTTNVYSVINQGFGATTQKINSGECNGNKPNEVQARIGYYTDYCQKFGVSSGENLSC